jgi:hypothetical protein
VVPLADENFELKVFPPTPPLAEDEEEGPEDEEEKE